jgi:hypothetical protein
VYEKLGEDVSRAVDLDGGCEEIERSAILNNCGNDTIKVQESTKLNKERGVILSYCSNRCIACGLRGMFNGMVKGMLRRVWSQGLWLTHPLSGWRFLIRMV